MYNCGGTSITANLNPIMWLPAIFQHSEDGDNYHVFLCYTNLGSPCFHHPIQYFAHNSRRIVLLLLLSYWSLQAGIITLIFTRFKSN